MALATWAELPALSPDDQLLVGALAAERIVGMPAVWTDGAVPWGRFDLVLVRSTWDYHRRLPEFLTWIDRVDRAGRLMNVASTLRWNCRKTYLRDLERWGIPTVPTVWGTEVDSATPALRDHGWDRAVIKPAVSANADRTFLLRASDKEENEAIFQRLRREGEVLLQPYLASVDGRGERSLVFFEGEFSHAVLRSPRLTPGSPIAEGEPTAVSPAELDLGRRAIGRIDPTPLYGRVDLVESADQAPLLLELELIEPFLYLASAPGASGQLVRAIRQKLSDGTRGL